MSELRIARQIQRIGNSTYIHIGGAIPINQYEWAEITIKPITDMQQLIALQMQEKKLTKQMKKEEAKKQ